MVSQKRRSEICAAAVELFDERGYYGTGMEDIAKVVGIRASSIYNHYNSKQQVLGDVSVQITEQLLREHAACLVGVSDPREKVRASMRNHVRFHATHAPQVRVSNREVKALQDPYAGIVRQLRRDYVQRWVQIIEEGCRQGLFTIADSKIATYYMVDMGTGVSVWFRPGGAYELDDLCELYANAALRLLRAVPPN
ncbi:TetR/AcrR family transcriptional regulator [Luteococcus sp. Sow4_B9]|uniref:TetR/AcrR family transcriptional regulator n=1 Tax=Luteococcus sp. Sow4_B9 TaxID=3438792 RepID=UPI003F96EBB9